MPGAVIMEGGDSVGVGRSRTAYDYFLSMFPMDQLTRMVRLTSTNLQGRGLPATTAGEMLKFIGVLILATRYEFGARAELWATKARNPYLVAPAFGERTGLSRCRFDALWTAEGVPEVFVCGPKSGRLCFDEHLSGVHALDA
eukprot:contig_19035_g4703